jgi:hypothetical protein
MPEQGGLSAVLPRTRIPADPAMGGKRISLDCCYLFSLNSFLFGAIAICWTAREVGVQIFVFKRMTPFKTDGSQSEQPC